MKYAIIKAGSNQLKVSEGDKIKLLGSINKPQFDILFFSDGSKIIMDADQLGNVTIKTEKVKEGRGRKLVVGRYKSKSRYDKQRGFRTQYTEFMVSGINFGKAEKVTKEAEADAPEVSEKKPIKRTAKKLTKKEAAE